MFTENKVDSLGNSIYGLALNQNLIYIIRLCLQTKQ